MSENFSHQDLRGQSFKGQDLTGADFSYADIRGVSFKDAILKEANFINTKGGITKKSFAVYLLMILIISVIAGGVSAYLGLWVEVIVQAILKNFKANTDTNNILYTLLYFAVYALISVILIQKGKYNILTISIIMSGVMTITYTIAGAKAIAIGELVVVAVAGGGTVVVASAEVGVLTGVLYRVFAGYGVITFAMGGALMVAITKSGSGAGSAAILLILSSYIAYRINKEDEQFDTYRKFGLSLSSLFGTNFQNADLTGANLTGAVLKNCRFNGVKSLMHTCFSKSQNLKLANLSGTILENKAVRELLATGNGKNQSFKGLNLKGAYLVGADLSGADFIEADLSGADLRKANLKKANLTKTQVIGTVFSGADLTGACLEAWNIDFTTNIKNVRAKYVYMLQGKKERKPASGNFGKGQFEKLFQEVLDTVVELIFKKGIYRDAFNESLEKVRQDNHISEVSVRGFEKIADDILLYLNVPPGTDKGKIQGDFMKEYHRLKHIEIEYKAELKARDRLIECLTDIAKKSDTIITTEVNTMNGQRNVNITGNVSGTNVVSGDGNVVGSGNTMNQQNRNMNVGGNFNNTGVFNSGDISGSVSNTIQQLPASSDPAKPGLRELLTKLQTEIEKSSEIPQKSKDGALKRVKELAEIAANPNEDEKDKAQNILAWFATKLPMATAAAEGLKSLIGSISEIFPD